MSRAVSFQRNTICLNILFFSPPDKGTLLFDGKAQEALDKAKKEHGEELKINDNSVTWQLLEGDEEKDVMKKIIEAQQGSFSRCRGRGEMHFHVV